MTQEVSKTTLFFPNDCGFQSSYLQCAMPFKLAHQIVKPLTTAHVSVNGKINHKECWSDLW